MKIKNLLSSLLCLILLNCSSDNDNSEPTENIFNGDIVVSSQAEVDQLEIYTKITGDLRIETVLSSTDIINLSVFNNLTEIGGDFILENNSGVMNTDNFSKVQSVGGSLELINNGIKNLNGFSSLENIGSNLTIRNNALENLNGFANLISIGGDFNIKQSQISSLQAFENVTSTLSGLIWLEMENLQSLNGLPKIGLTTESVVISQTKIQSLDQFADLQNIEGILEINNNDNLVSLNGFQNLNSIQGKLSLRGNDSLQNLDKINSLSILNGELDIFGNINLENINGLSSLNSVGGYIKIYYNDILSNLNGLSNIDSTGGRLEIESNIALKDFCGLNSLFNSGGTFFNIRLNAYNPTEQNFTNGNCSI